MRKIFKLFPVALAVVALASCSNDDFMDNGASDIQLKSNQILVTTEDLSGDDATRAGFVEDEIDGKLKFVAIFNKGDVMKIYDDQNNWRPQDWECTSDNDVQYTNNQGVYGAVFEAPQGVTQYGSGYGIYPSKYGTKKFGEFADEDRTSMKFDFDMFKVFDATVGAANLPSTSDYKDGLFCKFPVPMWGVAANQKMTLKYLTAFLRIDVTNLPATAADNSKWLLIRSNQALTGEFTATGIDPDNANTGLKVAAPVLVGPTATTSTDAITAYPKTGSATGNTDILVNLGQFAGGDITVYVPIAAGKDKDNKINHNFTVYLSNDVANTAPSIDFTGCAVKGSDVTPVAKSVYRGQVYSIVDDSRNINTTAHTPYDLTKAIVDFDKQAKRDFEITFGNPIKVKNDDKSTQNYYLDLSFTNYSETGYSSYALKHNVVVNVNLVKDASAIAPRVLYIKTPEGGKQLTLNLTDWDEIAKIVIKDGELKSKLVLTGVDKKMPAIEIGANNDNLVTIKKGVTTAVTSKSDFTINTPYLNTSDKVEGIVLSNGIKNVLIEKGLVNHISIDAAAPIENDVTIKTTGQVGIQTVNLANMKTNGTTTKTDVAKLVFTSIWDGTTMTSSGFTTTTVSDGTTTVNNVIVTAAQLANMKTASTDYTVLGTFDLNGENNAWTPLTGADKSITGAAYFKYANTGSATRAIEGNAVIKNLKGENGLLASWTPAAADDAISKLTFDGGNEISKDGQAAMGLLVGAVSTATASGKITDILVKGTNSVKSEGANTSKGIAAVIGKVSGTNALNISNVKVETGTTVKGFQYVGGIIGQIGQAAVGSDPAVAGVVSFGVRGSNGADKFTTDAAFATGDATLNSSAATLETYRVNTTAPRSSALPSFGQYYGGIDYIATDGDVKILVANTADFTTADRTSANNLWGYYVPTGDGEYYSWDVTLKFAQFGHYGTDISSYSVADSFGKYAQFLTKNGSNKYALVTSLKPYIGKQFPTGAAAPKWSTTSATGVWYYTFVKNPLP